MIIRYDSSRVHEWNDFIGKARNGTFLFLREYMDYHSDRFKDHSLMCYDTKGRLEAVMPANEKDGVLYSHQGLTYGGWVLADRVRTNDVGDVFSATVEYLAGLGFTEWYYKQMPTIYHRIPSQEDEYWLWRYGATIEQCLISACVPVGANDSHDVERRRRRGLQRAMNCGYSIVYDAPLEEFWPVMVNNLRNRYDVAPVHTLEEMQLLQGRCTGNIRCHTVKDNEGRVVAGCVIYDCNASVVHVQYGHATAEGKANGALDLLYLTLIEHYRCRSEKKFFDFGNSNEQGGKVLNNNLSQQKEGFGGRGVTYKLWKIKIDSYEVR